MLYVLEETSIREELLKRYYNNFLTKHFDINKILKLITRKYY